MPALARQQINALKFADETACLNRLLAELQSANYDAQTVSHQAAKIVDASRAQKSRQGTLDAFLNEFGLSNQEGVTLMCLAEALLRVPDDKTQDALIAEKILAGDWKRHQGHSERLFVNAGVWGLMLTGQMLDVEASARKNPGSRLSQLAARTSTSAIRRAVKQAMAIMGSQFVFGRDIDEALGKRRELTPKERLYSFDMLGEGARTASAAERYFQLYSDAITRLGEAVAYDNNDLSQRSSISIKLSALHPRYERAQEKRVFAELFPRVLLLAQQAKEAGLPLTIDAEEADRLDISLEILERLAMDSSLQGWSGLGLALQAYQKRGREVIRWLGLLAETSQRQIPVRLVKGAYWDTEIKHSQVEGHPDYPVFTTKAATDLSYLACAQALFNLGDKVYPQFATHNAHTIAGVMHMAQGRPFEFQRLHGMGELLYRAARQTLIGQTPLRVYAPVGAHQDLLPYLVRRLLENGANSSFVHRFLNDSLPVAEVVMDPNIAVQQMLKSTVSPPHLPKPPQLYGSARKNSASRDLSDTEVRASLENTIAFLRREARIAGCLVNGELCGDKPQAQVNPANTQQVVGEVRNATPANIENALQIAQGYQSSWDIRGGNARAHTLRAMADALEDNGDDLIGLICLEAGRTLPDAVSEWREAVDFCRYYADQAERLFATPQTLPGPTGESNTLAMRGRGVFLCISPWNFPLAIFTGQVAAALAAGNTVIAKPAEQTPIVAYRAVQLFLKAGLPKEALQLLPGSGLDVAEPLVADERISGVAFTGSTKTAKRIQRTLAAREGAIVPLIAETGGQNAMIVDSTALLEQACDDILDSAFGSAGQRCSALRVLLLQEEIADEMIAMLKEALQERKIGDPSTLSTDIGPLIDPAAKLRLDAHAKHMNQDARPLATASTAEDESAGYFFAPRIFEIRRIDQLTEEVFGPVLHILRWTKDTLDTQLERLRDTGFGLTFGIHSRLDHRQNELVKQSLAGNVYVNRSMIGAVVGVQPFGGCGLSGTGPKTGGPHYLTQFGTERTICINTAAIGGNTELFK